MAPVISTNDCVLLTSLLYLSIDMQYQWHEFASCQWPIHTWLLVSYFFILAFRLTHVLGTYNAAAGSGDFLLNLRHKDTLTHLLMSITWLLVLPLFALWTGIGTFWLWKSKSLSETCLPMGMPLVFIITWQALSYAWILIHTTLGGVAWVLERRLRFTEGQLRSMEDSDTLARWGQVSQLAGYTSLTNTALGGLTPDQIHSLPESIATEAKLGEEKECSICLNEICQDDSIRQLGRCGHAFHRSCIDLWLLRSPHCPLCKQNVLGDCPEDGKPAAATAGVEVDHWHV